MRLPNQSTCRKHLRFKSLRVGDTGREPGSALPTDSSQTAISTDAGAANSGAVTDSDPLSAFVATLTPEQRAALVRLLTNG